MYTTLIDHSQLAQHLSDPDWVVVDCRFSLQETEQGLKKYKRTHIPGAVYAHLEHDLSGTTVPCQTGRHPLPPIEQLVYLFSTWGIDSSVQVVAYDDSAGLMAARLWWLLRWMNHDAIAVLDGGWQEWQKNGHPVTGRKAEPVSRTFQPSVRQELLMDTSDVFSILYDPKFCLIDSRTGDRYRGEHEPIDPVSGHIPGAINMPFIENIGEDGRFLSSNALKARFHSLSESFPSKQTVFYCGSGVSASHNLLALSHAGLGNGRLYMGSWSEWITDPGRPIVKGAGQETLYFQVAQRDEER